MKIRTAFLIGLAVCVILLCVPVSCLVYVNSQGRQLEARRVYWHKQLDQLVHDSASPETADKFFYDHGVRVDISPKDPTNGRFKLQGTDTKTFYTFYQPYTAVMFILVYDSSRKPIGYTVDYESLPTKNG